MKASIRAMLKPGSSFGVLALLLALTLLAVPASAVPLVKILRGANQQTTYAAAFPAPLEVWVTEDTTGRALPGVRVDFAAGDGISLSATYAVTDERGLASVSATGLAAGTYSVNAQAAGFPGTRVGFDGLMVNKAALTVVPADLVTTPAGSVPAIASYTIEGFVNGDTVETSHITGLPAFSTTATDHSRHANYAIKGGIGSLSAPNYTFVAGFGTLAVLTGPNADSVSADQQDISLSPLQRDDAIAVRPALKDQPVAKATTQPAFLAGLRGQSGVFVREAIWQNSSASSVAMLSFTTRTALPPVAQGIRNASNAPVRAAALPKQASTTASWQPASTRSAMPMVAAADGQRLSAPVRAVPLPRLATPASATQSSFADYSIRKALTPPGSN